MNGFHPKYQLCDIMQAIGGYGKFNDIVMRGEKAGFTAQQAVAKYIEHNNLDEKINREKAYREEKKRQNDKAYMKFLEKNSGSKNTWSSVSE